MSLRLAVQVIIHIHTNLWRGYSVALDAISEMRKALPEKIFFIACAGPA